MCVHVCVCTCLPVYPSIYTCLCMYLSVYPSVCTCLYMYLSVCTCLCLYLSVCVPVYLYLSVYVPVCLCTRLSVPVCVCRAAHLECKPLIWLQLSARSVHRHKDAVHDLVPLSTAVFTYLLNSCRTTDAHPSLINLRFLWA